MPNMMNDKPYKQKGMICFVSLNPFLFFVDLITHLVLIVSRFIFFIFYNLKVVFLV